MAIAVLPPAVPLSAPARPSVRPARRPVDRSAGVRTSAPSRVVRPARRASADRGGVRLTTRGRIVLLVAALAAVLAVLVSTGPVQAGSTAPAGPATDLVVVQPGQSLWEIAADAAPGADRRATVDAIMGLNGLTDAVVHPGQPLVVPVG